MRLSRNEFLTLLAFFGPAWQRVTNLNSFAGQISLTMGTNVVIAAMGIGTGLLSARLLGPQGRGELAAIQLWPLLLAGLALLGMPEAVVFFSSRFRDQCGRYLISAQALILITATGFVGIGWWLMPRMLSAQSPEIVAAARIFLLAMTFLYAIIGMPHQAIRAVGAWRAWNVLRALPNLGWLMVLLSMFVIPELINPVLLSRLYLGVHIALVVPFILTARRYISRPYAVQTGLFKPLLGYGIPTMLHLLPQSLNLRLDQLFMATYLEPSLLGLYVVAVTWSSATAPIFSAVGPVLFPRLSAISDSAQQNLVLTRVTRLAIAAILGLTVVLLVITPVALPWLFGNAYRPAVPAALILVVANAFSSLNLILTDGLRGLGRPRSVLVAELVGLVVTGVLLLLLLRPFGILGAAVASLVAYATVSGWLAVSVNRAIPLRAVVS